MRTVYKLFALFMCSVIVLYVLLLGVYQNHSNGMKNIEFYGLNYFGTDKIFIGAAICGKKDQAEKALLMIKSAILFRGKLHVHFLIVCTKQLQEHMRAKLEKLKVKVNNSFTYELHNPYFPREDEKFWHFWFKECATERLFYPYMFKNVELMVHADNDVLFVNDLSDFWQHAYRMNRSQMFALGPDLLDPKDLERHKSQYPLTKAPSLNAGIMILNLKKMVEFGWLSYIRKVVDIYGKIFSFADQDIIRFTVMLHPDKLYLLSCKYNIHWATCHSKVRCLDVEKDGIFVLHGTVNAFVDHPQYKAIAGAFHKYEFGIDSRKHMIVLLKNALKSIKNEFCGFPSNVIFHNTFKALATD